MKKIITFIIFTILLFVTFANTSSAISIGWDRYTSGILRTLYGNDRILIGGTTPDTSSQLEVNGDITASYITASSTSTSTLPVLSVSTAFDFLGEYITDATAWVRGKISSSVTGISYNNSTGVISLDSGYEIPTTASTSDWNTDNDTTYTADGTFLDLTGTVFSLNEGTLTDTKICTYEAGTGIVCTHTDADTTYTASNGLTILSENIQPDTGYTIPLTASTTEWLIGYLWGDHALAGYTQQHRQPRVRAQALVQ